MTLLAASHLHANQPHVTQLRYRHVRLRPVGATFICRIYFIARHVSTRKISAVN